MSKELSPEMIQIIKAWYERPHNYDDPEFDVDTEVNGDIYEAYLLGIRDGKTELATDIMESLDLINYN